MLRSARAAAKRGAKLLDKALPGWHRKVKITQLDMSYPFYYGDCGCVLAQAYGSYNNGLQELDIDTLTDADSKLGFNASTDNYNFDELNTAWKEQIRERRGKGKAA